MRKPLQQTLFFQHRDASVSPSWVRFGKTSYAVRSINKLTYKKIQAPRIARYALLFVSLTLIYFSAQHVLRQTLPGWLALVLLLASTVLFIVSVWLAFFRGSRHQVSIGLYDASEATSRWRDERDASELYGAITRAMDCHLGGGDAGSAQVIASVAARRKALNTWSRISSS